MTRSPPSARRLWYCGVSTVPWLFTCTPVPSIAASALLAMMSLSSSLGDIPWVTTTSSGRALRNGSVLLSQFGLRTSFVVFSGWYSAIWYGPVATGLFS